MVFRDQLVLDRGVASRSAAGNPRHPRQAMLLPEQMPAAPLHPHEGGPMNKPVTDIPHPKMLLDPYAIWAANEGVPITEDFGANLLKLPTCAWPRFGVDGGIVHMKGRGDFVSIFV